MPEIAEIGDAEIGDVQGGDVQGGDVQGGDVQGGDAEIGDVQGGDVQGGDVQGGDAEIGDVQGGDDDHDDDDDDHDDDEESALVDRTGEMVIRDKDILNNFEDNMKLIMFKSHQLFQSQVSDLTRIVSNLGQRMVQKISDVETKIDAVDNKVDDMQKRLDEMRSESSHRDDSASYMTDLGRQIWPLIPLLFNGEKGYCGWCPVTFKDHGDGKNVSDNEDRDVVILSIPMTRWLISEIPGKSFLRDKIVNFLKGNLDRVDRSINKSFIDIIIRTPFKPYVLGTEGKKITFRHNEENYIIMNSAYWTKVLNDIDTFFPNRMMSLDERFPEKCIPANVMIQSWSLVRSTHEDGRSAPITSARDRVLSLEERKAMPAMTYPWWKEAYNSGAAKFFGMPVEQSKFHHVVFGKYNPESSSVKSFDRVLKASMNETAIEEVDPVKKGKGKGRVDKRVDKASMNETAIEEVDPVKKGKGRVDKRVDKRVREEDRNDNKASKYKKRRTEVDKLATDMVENHRLV